jgi:UDP:flavonoid glycosyltransferase YjiC (YdhE family)
VKSSRILFACRPLSGHFEPLLPLAHAARAAGHDVAFASGDPIVGKAEAAGFGAFSAGPDHSFRAEWAPRFPGFTDLVGDAMREFFFTEIFANLELVPRATDLEAVIGKWHPDVVVHEIAELAAPLVCTSLGVPYVDVGYGPLTPRPLLEAAGAAAAPHWRARGLDPHPLAGLYRYLYVDPCPPALQSEAIVDVETVQRMRPIDVDALRKERPEWFDDLPNRPIVYVTLGTIWNRDLRFFDLVIEALRDDVNLVVTVGSENDPEVFGRQPSSVVIRRFIPQHEVLPFCAAAVMHGGAGTMLGALAHGVPLLVIPQGADQWANAERVVASGAGRRLLRDEVSAVAVHDELTALLGDPSYTSAAADIGDQIRDMPPVSETIARIEALVSTSRPAG